MKKSSTVHAFRNEIFKEQKLTIGLDLGMCVAAFGGQSYPTATVSRYNRALNRFGSRPANSF
ncbi:MAG: hypothetical protein DMG38_13150 [Acidobacteria bacterium]|nr:MAG: hypothetical protein DMG38_13150 [Acidobacteriota bacterium]